MHFAVLEQYSTFMLRGEQSSERWWTKVRSLCMYIELISQFKPCENFLRVLTWVCHFQGSCNALLIGTDEPTNDSTDMHSAGHHEI